MTTIYNFAWAYTKSKVATTPANAPTCKIVNIDADTALVSGATPTLLTAQAGAYKYQYSGADGLNLLGIASTADTTVDQQDLFSYPAALPVIKAMSDKLETMLQADGSDWQYTAAALELGPAGSATVAITASDAADYAANEYVIRKWHTFEQSITSTSTDALDTARIWFGAKCDPDDDDADAIILFDTDDGLTVINQDAPTGGVDAADGSITVTGAPGAWVITLRVESNATGALTFGEGRYYAAAKYSLGTDDVLLDEGIGRIKSGVVHAM
jgi:hypothetical protein